MELCILDWIISFVSFCFEYHWADISFEQCIPCFLSLFEINVINFWYTGTYNIAILVF